MDSATSNEQLENRLHNGDEIDQNETKLPESSLEFGSTIAKDAGGDHHGNQTAEKDAGHPRFGQLIEDTQAKLSDLNISEGRRSVREERKQTDEENSEDEYYDVSSEGSIDGESKDVYIDKVLERTSNASNESINEREEGDGEVSYTLFKLC